MAELNIKQKLSAMQVELNAPKGQFNAFGKYKYRSLEDIYEGLKKLINKYAVTVVVDNELEVIGGIIFRKSIATLSDCESDDEIKVQTFTQESLQKKGMSSEQCSGSTMSYSDKYCLNKLFCIDDNKDPDTAPPKDNIDYKKINELNGEVIKLLGLMTEGKTKEEKFSFMKEAIGVNNPAQLKTFSADKLSGIIQNLKDLMA